MIHDTRCHISWCDIFFCLQVYPLLINVIIYMPLFHIRNQRKVFGLCSNGPYANSTIRVNFSVYIRSHFFDLGQVNFTIALVVSS